MVVVITSCHNQDIPTPIVHYSFSSNAINDKNWFNNLDNNGAKNSSDRFGISNSAYYFDGTTASMIAKLSDLPNINSSLTISWWFKIEDKPFFKDSLDAGNMIALVDTTQAIGLQFGYRAPGYKTKGLDVWNWGGGTIIECQKPEINQWHHCAYTYDGYTHRFYLDGQQISESKVKPQSGRPNQLTLGNYPGGTQYFEGSLDEIQIYDKDLDSSKIAELFMREKARPSK
jgi:hypothetical protein